jgi:hypothetical protein
MKYHEVQQKILVTGWSIQGPVLPPNGTQLGSVCPDSVLVPLGASTVP